MGDARQSKLKLKVSKPVAARNIVCQYCKVILPCTDNQHAIGCLVRAKRHSRGPGQNKIDPERFAKMAGAMDAALDDMRTLYGMVARWSESKPVPLCTLADGEERLVLNKQGVDALLATIVGVTERLRHGLKARIAR